MFYQSQIILLAAAVLVAAIPNVEIEARDSNIFKRTNSPNGVCGGLNNTATCTGTGFGKCCSYWGWCGNDNLHCGYGCQPNFGTCGVNAPSVKWVTDGCYTTTANIKTLRYSQNVAQNSVEVCTAACAAGGYIFAGMESGSQCYCDSAIQTTGSIATSGCTVTCQGKSTEICGGTNRLSVYTTAPPTWQSLGCYTDIPSSRTLPIAMNIAGNTQERCQAACKTSGYKYSGTEFGSQCFCGNTIATTSIVSGSCAMPCAGNSAENCGGVNTLTIFVYE